MIYKVITKIITSRLQLVMDYLVDEVQGAEVKNRSIVDNILVCQGLVRGYNRMAGSPRCLLKLDLRKAYDMLDFYFICRMLQALNFPDKFVGWIRTCISTAMFSLVLNGGPCGFFPSKRGVRQGDPMSPYLFVLCMEYFTRMVRGLSLNPSFNFHPKCKDLNLTHVMFADDMMLLCKADKQSPLLLKECFDSFAAVSGLSINVQKSQIFFAAVEEEIKQF